MDSMKAVVSRSPSMSEESTELLLLSLSLLMSIGAGLAVFAAEERSVISCLTAEAMVIREQCGGGEKESGGYFRVFEEIWEEI